jgi:hypothetical protein
MERMALGLSERVFEDADDAIVIVGVKVGLDAEAQASEEVNGAMVGGVYVVNDAADAQFGEDVLVDEGVAGFIGIALTPAGFAEGVTNFGTEGNIGGLGVKNGVVEAVGAAVVEAADELVIGLAKDGPEAKTLVTAVGVPPDLAGKGLPDTFYIADATSEKVGNVGVTINDFVQGIGVG